MDANLLPKEIIVGKILLEDNDMNSERRVRENVELLVRQGNLKGKMRGYGFVMPASLPVSNRFINACSVISYIIIACVFFPALDKKMGYDFEYLMSIFTNGFYQICFAIMFFFIILKKLCKSYQVINFSEKKLYTTNLILGIEVGPRRDEISMFSIIAIGIDTKLSRKRIYYENQPSTYIQFKQNVLAKRDISSLSRFYDFSSEIILILEDGKHFAISSAENSEEMFEKFKETATSLSNAFEIPLLVCNHGQKIDFRSWKPSNKSNTSDPGEETLPKIIPIFTEEDFKKMKQELNGGPIYVSPYEE